MSGRPKLSRYNEEEDGVVVEAPPLAHRVAARTTTKPSTVNTHHDTIYGKTATSISINIVRVLPTARLILDAFAASQRASRVTARALDSNQTFLARVQTDRRRLRM